LRAAGIAYRPHRGGAPLVEGVEFDLQPGMVTGLVGPNGAGKTTLIKLLAGLLKPESGDVFLDGRRLSDVSPTERGRQIGYVEQAGSVAWPLSVERVVSLGRTPHGEAISETHPAVQEALRSCGLEHLRTRTVSSLSGGERTLVLLARAIAGEPNILLTDEPTAGLDARHQLQLMDLLSARAKSGAAVLVAAHDLSLVARYCDRLAVMVDARLVDEDSPSELIKSGALERAYGVEFMTAEGPAPMLVPWQIL